MEESFELLSSMSPRLKGRQKTLKKAITILALKKHIRRSSIYDKALAVNNANLAIVDASTDSSESTSYIKRNVIKNNKNNENSVVIIDSTDSEDVDDFPRLSSKKLSSGLLKNNAGKATKVDRIQEWLENINLSEKKDDITFFSQVSTIYGDDAPRFDPDGNKLAACSTFNENVNQRFDELFVSDKNDLKKKPDEDLISDDSFSIEINTSLNSKLKENSLQDVKKLMLVDKNQNGCDIRINDSVDSDFKTKSKQIENDNIIDETLLTSDESIEKLSNSFHTPKLTPDKTPDRPLPANGDFVTTRKKNDTKPQRGSVSDSLGNSDEMESMLDSLYGVKWREKQNHVLPLSEPKKKQAEFNYKKILAPNTERKTNPSTKGNLQKNQNLTIKKVSLDKLRKPLAPSPWMERLKGLVDSDSDSNAENANEKTRALDAVKTRLNFQDSPLPKTRNVSNIGIISDKKKIHFDDSYMDESLEDRIRRKMNNFKVPPKPMEPIKKGRNTKTKTSNKENDRNTENKIKSIDTKKVPKKKPLLETGSAKKNMTKETNKKTQKTKVRSRERSKSTSSTNSCSEIEISSDEEYDKEITRLYEVKRKSIRPVNDGFYSFLESLSGNIPYHKCDVSARIYRTSFKHYREELGKKLFSLYNEKVFNNAIPSDTEIEWNDKLRNTAGLCYCKKITHRDGNVVRKVKIALSTKVLDSPDRLRDTLIHEMCHAGTWIINQISNGHGIYWKNWAFKAMKIFPELPPIKRCHSYQINTKYTYKCTGCGYSFGRHSKSLDLERKRCGHCYGKFEVLLNKTLRSGETKAVPITPRKEVTGFALFVKENYGRYKDPSRKHGDVMKLLGQKFSELKVKTAA